MKSGCIGGLFCSLNYISITKPVEPEIRNNPTLKARVIGALKSGGKEAFKEAVDNPLVNVLIAIIEGSSAKLILVAKYFLTSGMSIS